MNSTSNYVSTTGTGIPSYELQQGTAREVASREEMDRTEKTLHHLAGRVEELRERLSTVLTPQGSQASGNDQKVPVPTASLLTENLRRFQSLAQGSLNTMEDILNRLDV